MSSQEQSDLISIRTFAPGDYLFTEGEQSFHFYIIQEGSVEIFKNGGPDGKIPLATLSEGQSVGEFAMIDRQPRSASARALTDVKAAFISDTAAQELLADLPEWAAAIMQSLVSRFREMHKLIIKHQLRDETLLREISNLEYDPDKPTVVKAHPLFSRSQE